MSVPWSLPENLARIRKARDLSEARDLAPDWVRCQPLGAATMRTLVDRAARRRGEDFASLAAHYGVVAETAR